jgi:hypothetical protein
MNEENKQSPVDAKVHPAPSMLWMLIPIGLLALLALLSR